MADSEPSKNNKRRLRAPAQTVRQKAEKAQATTDKPARGRRLRSAASNTKKPFAKAGKIFDRQPFKFIGLIFHYIGLILVPRFVRNAFQELKLVTWPDAKQTRQLTTAVLLFAIVFGVAVTLVDYGLDKLFKALILNN